MNLIDAPWIPVADPEGRGRGVGLREAFSSAGSLRDLVLPPPQRVAVMRLLICITQAALDGPEGEEEWIDCRERIPDVCIAYLDSRKEKFELFGGRPFLQIPDLETTSDAGRLDKLDFGLAAGNNHTLFDNGATPDGRPHPAAWAALHLLTFQNFSPGGLIGPSKWGGGKPFGKNSTSAPCVKMVHAFIRGRDLLETIHMNLLTRKEVNDLPNGKWGAPVWDRFPESAHDKQGTENATRTYLGRLVPLSRVVKLEPGENGSAAPRCIIGQADDHLRFFPFPDFREPSATVVKSRKDETLLHCLALSPDRHLWRELGSVLAVARAMEAGGPLTIRKAKKYGPRLTDREQADIWTGGLATDQAKVVDALEWNFSVPYGMMDEIELGRYEEGVKYANRVEGRLRSAVKACFEALSHLQGNDKKARDTREKAVGKAVSAYWGSLDREYEALVDATTSEAPEPFATWWKKVLMAADAAYRQACPAGTPRQIQAFTLGLKRLKGKRTAEKEAGQ